MGTPPGSVKGHRYSGEALLAVPRMSGDAPWGGVDVIRFDDRELGHHSVVFVAQDMAVEHVGGGRVGVVGEVRGESGGGAGWEEDGVFRTGEAGGGGVPRRGGRAGMGGGGNG